MEVDKCLPMTWQYNAGEMADIFRPFLLKNSVISNYLKNASRV